MLNYQQVLRIIIIRENRDFKTFFIIIFHERLFNKWIEKVIFQFSNCRAVCETELVHGARTPN